MKREPETLSEALSDLWAEIVIGLRLDRMVDWLARRLTSTRNG